MLTFVVPSNKKGERLDVFVAENIPELSRTSVNKLCKSQKITVNKIEKPAKYNLKERDIVSVMFDPADIDEIPNIEIPVLYEDDDCIVINKPAGILSHSKGGFNPEATVASFIRNNITDIKGERAGIVHRLDRATSGVMVCAKHQKSLHSLQKQFSTRKAVKTYLAVIKGALSPESAVINMPIARNPKQPKMFYVSVAGKEAITVYRTIRNEEDKSLLELSPKTGRTHQLRVHLKKLGHPIIGDELYGGSPYKRLLLHAYSLEIQIPNGRIKMFSAPVPSDFDTIFTSKYDS